MKEQCGTCEHREPSAWCDFLERFVGDAEWCGEWHGDRSAPPDEDAVMTDPTGEVEPLEIELPTPTGGMCGTCGAWQKTTLGDEEARLCLPRGVPTLASNGCGLWSPRNLSDEAASGSDSIERSLGEAADPVCGHEYSTPDSASELAVGLAGLSAQALEVAERAATLEFERRVVDQLLTSEGRKDDEAKPRYDLIAPELLEALGEVLRYGADKYAPRNWELGLEWGRVFAALQRHAWAWWGGENLDKETGLSHLHHAACCLMFLIAYEARGVGQDDRFTLETKQETTDD